MEGSTLTAEERAAERAAAFKVAKWGVVGALAGALIGGLGSFLGAYLTYKAQTQTHTEDVKSAAYGKFATEAQSYRLYLRQLVEAAKTDDQKAYTTARETLFQARRSIYQAAATVYIVSDDFDVVDSASKVNNVFLRTQPLFEPLKVTAVDPKHFLAIIHRSNQPFSKFLRAARADLVG